MEVRYTFVQTLFGIVVANYFNAEWWGFGLAMPAAGALAYYTSLMMLRRLDLKPSANFLDYLDALRKRNAPGS